MKLLLSTLLTALIPLSISTAYADVVVEIESDIIGGGQKSEMFISGDKIRMMHRADGRDTTMIFRGDKKLIWTVDESNKKYMKLDESSMQKVSGMMNHAMKQMETQMASMPPQQKAMMEQMMKGQMGAMMPKKEEVIIDIKKTSDRQTINDISCTKYEVYRNGEKNREYWVAAPGDVKGGKEVSAAFKTMSEFFEKLIKSMGNSQMIQAFDNPYSTLNKIDGLPVKTVEFENGRKAGSIIIKSVVAKRISNDKFMPPQGYSLHDPFQQLN